MATLALALIVAGSAYAQTTEVDADQNGPQDLTDLNLDDLANIQVTTASKKAESLFGVAASLYVVTAEDIKRSGAVNIPEALRMVPGVQVGQLDAQTYAVSIRGFNGRVADKLLVLIDGRSIYNTLWGGVYWDEHNIPMEEIERIEVVRGPGGTLWGANAVNGIVNIITKNAKDTQGFLAQFEAGQKVDLNSATFRYGSATKNGHFRLSAHGLRKGATLDTRTLDAFDKWDSVRGSLRFDGGSEKSKLTVLADWRENNYTLAGFVKGTSAATLARVNEPSKGGSIVAKFDNEYANGSSSSFQMFYDKMGRMLSPRWNIQTATLDFDFQFSPPAKGDTSVIYGFGYRHVNDDYTSPESILLDPKRSFGVFSGFVQREQKIGKSAKFSIGTKVEHNEFSGFEVQPSLRYAHEGNQSAYWMSLSRAVRTPNQVFDNARLSFSSPGGEIIISGDPSLPSLSVIAAEFGYRKKVNSNMTLDGSAFYNSYDNLDGSAMGAPFMTFVPYPHMVFPMRYIDAGKGKTYGFELVTKMQVSNRWRVDVGYSYLAGDIPAAATAIDSPKHQANLLSTLTLSDSLSFDQAVYFVGKQTSGVDSYTRVDLQARYRMASGMEVAVGARHLGTNTYQQGSTKSSNFFEPTLFAKASWKF